MTRRLLIVIALGFLIAGCKPQTETELAIANQQLGSEEAKLLEFRKAADESKLNIDRQYGRVQSMQRLAFDESMVNGAASNDEGKRALAAAQAARNSAIEVLESEIRNMTDAVKEHGTAVRNIQAQEKVVSEARVRRDKLVVEPNRPQASPGLPDPEIARTNEAAALYDQIALRKSKAEILDALSKRGFELKKSDSTAADLSGFNVYNRLVIIAFSEHLGKLRFVTINVNTDDADPATREKMTELTALVGSMLLNQSEKEVRKIIDQGILDTVKAVADVNRSFGRLFGYTEQTGMLRVSPSRVGYSLTFQPDPNVHRKW